MSGLEATLARWGGALRDALLTERGIGVLEGLFLFVAGLILARAAAATVGRLMRGRATVQQRTLTRRAVAYGIVVIFTLAGMHAAGIDLSVLLGAAGILTVALGFASQTSVSNVISGLFLLGEKPFAVGDTIRIDDLTGEVLSIDLLSVKIRTFDNLFVRMPNETLLKSRITNLTRFPIRRLDIPIGVAYHSDIRHVFEVLTAIAAKNPQCLDEPKPLIIHQGFADSAIQLQFSVWFQRENLLPFRNAIHTEVQEAFAAAGIEIPFPQRTVTIVDAEASPAAEIDADRSG